MNNEFTLEYIESKLTILKNNEVYRINDVCKFRDNHFVCKKILAEDQYNGSILKKYLLRDHRDKHQTLYNTMIEHINEHNIEKYDDNKLLVHIRAGDNYRKAGLGNIGLNNRVMIEINNFISKNNNIDKIIIVTALHYGNSDLPNKLYRNRTYVYNDNNKRENIKVLHDFIKKQKKPVEIRSSDNIDEDFCLLSISKNLITSGGGFSSIVRKMNDKYYNKVPVPIPKHIHNLSFDIIKNINPLYLYCSELPRIRTNLPFIGLSNRMSNHEHIKHNITNKYNLPDNKVDIVLSEEIMCKIPFNLLKNSINEIYRILKPDGLFRLSLPDYRCDILDNRCEKDNQGNIIFDKGGGGTYDRNNKKIINGTLWFPKYEKVLSLLESTNFNNDKIRFLHYYDENNNQILNSIDYSKGFISRTPDHDRRVQQPRRPMSIVVDCVK